MTAAIGLLRNVGLDIPEETESINGTVPAIPTADDKKTSVVVYGAGSTVGVFVVQLAKVRHTPLGLSVQGERPTPRQTGQS